MFNLFRSDMYRMVRMRSFWICVAICAALMVTIVGFMNWISSPEFARMVDDSITEQSVQTLSEEERAELAEASAEMHEDLEPLNTKVLDSLTSSWGNSFFDGGFLGLIGSLFTAIFLLLDFKGGFIKSLPFDRRSRLKYYAEKLAAIAIIQAIFLGVCAACTTFAYWVFGFSYAISDSAVDIALWLLLAWLTSTAYAFIVACVAWASRNTALSCAVAIVASPGVLGAFLTQLFMYLGRAVPLFSQVPQWMLVSSYSCMRNGAEGLTAAGSGAVFAQLPAGAHAAIITLIYIIVMIVIALAACRRKDIR